MPTETAFYYKEFLIILGVAGLVVPLFLRIGVSSVLAFLIVGRSNNDYWGVILAPILGVSLIFAPRVIATLWRRSFPSPPGNEARMTSSEWNSRR